MSSDGMDRWIYTECEEVGGCSTRESVCIWQRETGRRVSGPHATVLTHISQRPVGVLHNARSSTAQVSVLPSVGHCTRISRTTATRPHISRDAQSSQEFPARRPTLTSRRSHVGLSAVHALRPPASAPSSSSTSSSISCRTPLASGAATLVRGGGDGRGGATALCDWACARIPTELADAGDDDARLTTLVVLAALPARRGSRGAPLAPALPAVATSPAPSPSPASDAGLRGTGGAARRRCCCCCCCCCCCVAPENAAAAALEATAATASSLEKAPAAALAER